jgi:hypothetical protein
MLLIQHGQLYHNWKIYWLGWHKGQNHNEWGTQKKYHTVKDFNLWNFKYGLCSVVLYDNMEWQMSFISYNNKNGFKCM